MSSLNSDTQVTHALLFLNLGMLSVVLVAVLGDDPFYKVAGAAILLLSIYGAYQKYRIARQDNEFEKEVGA